MVLLTSSLQRALGGLDRFICSRILLCFETLPFPYISFTERNSLLREANMVKPTSEYQKGHLSLTWIDDTQVVKALLLLLSGMACNNDYDLDDLYAVMQICMAACMGKLTCSMIKVAKSLELDGERCSVVDSGEMSPIWSKQVNFSKFGEEMSKKSH